MIQQTANIETSPFEAFQERLAAELFIHPVMTDNRYGAWFAKGDLSQDDVIAFTRQFSVFSNQFLVAQTQRVINAASVDEMRAAKEILANELGVVFRSRSLECKAAAPDIDPEVVGIEGTVDGGTFRFPRPIMSGCCTLPRRWGSGLANLDAVRSVRPRRFGSVTNSSASMAATTSACRRAPVLRSKIGPPQVSGNS